MKVEIRGIWILTFAVLLGAAMVFCFKQCGKPSTPSIAFDEQKIKKQAFDSAQEVFGVRVGVLEIENARLVISDSSARQERDWYKAVYDQSLSDAKDINKEVDRLTAIVQKQEGKNDTDCYDLSLKAADLSMKLVAQNMAAKREREATEKLLHIKDSTIDVQEALKQEWITANQYSKEAYDDLYKEVKKMKPRNQMFFGVVANGNEQRIVNAAGLGLTFVNKRGWLMGVDALMPSEGPLLYQARASWKIKFR